MPRFNAATLEGRSLNEEVAVSTMRQGLRGSRFTYSLDKNLLQTYAKLLELIDKYIRVEEGTSDRRQQNKKD